MGIGVLYVCVCVDVLCVCECCVCVCVCGEGMRVQYVCVGVLVQAEEEKARRQQLVARLPNVKHLNGSRVMEEERLDAERAFIRLFLDSQQKPDR